MIKGGSPWAAKCASLQRQAELRQRTLRVCGTRARARSQARACRSSSSRRGGRGGGGGRQLRTPAVDAGL